MLMLVFYVGKNLYAIESSRVIEVIPRVSYREVHHVPDYVAGVFNYRGSIVPVLDLCRLIQGIPSKGYLSTRVMMVSYSQLDGTWRYIGLMAEHVIETLNRAETEFKEAGIQTHESPYLGGILTDKKGMIQRICLEQLFSNVPHIHLLSAGV